MSTPTLTKNNTAGGTVNPYRFVKPGSGDGIAVQAAAATDPIMGVSNELGAASGERLDVNKGGILYIEYGGTVTRGDPLTADSVGRGVTAAPSAGVNNRIGGFAETSGVVGDIGLMQWAPGVMQGA